MDTCKRVLAHLNNFLDGTVGAEQAQEINAHLRDCGECRREYRALKATQELIRQAPLADGSAAQTRVMARFHQAVASTAPQFAPPLRVYSIRRAIPLGAAMMTAGALCLFMLPRLHPANPSVAPSEAPLLLATAACAPNLPTRMPSIK